MLRYPSHRAVVAVEGYRLGLVKVGVAGEIQAPAKINIFKEKEEGFVKTPEFFEDIPADKHCRAGAKQNWGRVLGFLADLGAGERTVSHPVPSHPRATEVNVGALPVENLGCHCAHIVISLKRFQRCGDPASIGLGVIVEKGNDLTGRVLDPEIAPPGEPRIGGRSHKNNVFLPLAQPLETSIT